MKNPVGRPMKYRHFVLILEDETLYCPATIVEHASRHGLVSSSGRQEEGKKLRIRIRHTLARFSKNHQFPEMGDGLVVMRGQAPQRAWFGWRWKKALPKVSGFGR